MSTYEELHGKRVEVFSSDPTLDSSYEGQVWYNSTSGVLKSVVLTEATHSGPAMLNKKSLYGGGVGTSTAGLTVGGIDDSTYLNVVEEWNGSGWAAGGNYPTYRYSAGTAGTQTAAMAYCGRVPGSPGGPTETYEYDGSSWTSGNSFPTPGNSMQGIGSVDTAVVSTEVYTSTNMHHWNGTSWTSANARNTAKGGQAAFGTQTAAVLAGGFPSDSNITELYNGTNWTSGNTMNTGRQQVAGSGTQTSGVAFGGDRPPSEAAQTTIESWDGTSWATSPATLATARARAGAGRNTAAGTWIAGGIGPNGGGEGFDATEIYENSINTVTAAAWSSGASLPGVRWNTSGAGIQTAGLIFGGATGPAGPAFLNTTFEYDGSSWTGGGATPINSINQFSAGIQTAAIGGGGLAKPSPGSNVATAYTYDGSSWTTITDTPTATKGAGGAGTSTACLIYGSDISDSSINQDSYYWNGSSWAEEGAMNTSFQNGASGGPTENTAFKAGSLFSGPETSTNFETYNGSAWTAGPALNTTVQQNRGFGSSADCLSIGGYNKITTVERYDGSAWHTSPSLGTGRKQFASSNFTAPGVANGWVGAGADGDSSVEHFTEETETVTAKTLTTS